MLKLGLLLVCMCLFVTVPVCAGNWGVQINSGGFGFGLYNGGRSSVK